MEIPEDLRELVDRLGRALVQALVTDEQCRDLARQIQEHGYEIGLMIEATLALQRREEPATDQDAAPGAPPRVPEESPAAEAPQPETPSWSEEDRAFLQKFKISLD